MRVGFGNGSRTGSGADTDGSWRTIVCVSPMASPVVSPGLAGAGRADGVAEAAGSLLATGAVTVYTVLRPRRLRRWMSPALASAARWLNTERTLRQHWRARVCTLGQQAPAWLAMRESCSKTMRRAGGKGMAMAVLIRAKLMRSPR